MVIPNTILYKKFLYNFSVFLKVRKLQQFEKKRRAVQFAMCAPSFKRVIPIASTVLIAAMSILSKMRYQLMVLHSTKHCAASHGRFTFVLFAFCNNTTIVVVENGKLALLCPTSITTSIITCPFLLICTLIKLGTHTGNHLFA